MDPVTAILAHPLTLMIAGMAVNLIKSVSDARSQNDAIDLPAYVRAHPYRIILGAVGALTGYGALAATNQLTAVGGFAAGYLGDDVCRFIAQGAKKRFSNLGG